MSGFGQTVKGRFYLLASSEGGYEGVTHAGIALVALDTGRVLLEQRAYDESDDADVRETWEFPGGGLDEGEDPFAGAIREFTEETGLVFPETADVVWGWRSRDGVYQGFVATIPVEMDLSTFVPNEEAQALAWYSRSDIEENENLRPVVRDETDWGMIFKAVSGNEESAMTAAMGESEVPDEVEPDLTWADVMGSAIPIHGVLAPEDIETGDGRGFNAGSMTSRPGILPFSWQKAAIGGHDGSVVTGGLTRMMRKDGLIHYEGMLMPSEEAGEFAGLLAFFGRFGVSVDGDNGSLDMEKSKSTGVMWFDAVRAAGLTAVAIPAFHEAYVAFGPHPDMPAPEAAMTASMLAKGDLVEFDRGPGWVSHPRETKRIHDYWTKKGQPGYAKIGWGTPGDFTRAKKLIGAKIGANSPEDMRYLNQIIAQWHFDALGYWPGDLGKPGNAPDTPENRRRAARHAAASKGIVLSEDEEDEEGEWEVVLTSSVGTAVRPPRDYFEYQGEDKHGALTISEPDEFGIRHTYGYAAEWGVCHIGYDGRCVEAPHDTKDFADFHLGYTRLVDGSKINTGVITYMVDHRDADTILTETAQQSHFDNIANAWASVRLGMDDRGIWFSGIVLPGIPDEDITLIEATGQVSGEWRYGALRALQAVNVPGYPVQRSSAAYDDDGNVVALVASAHNLGGCEPTPAERIAALRTADAEARFGTAKARFARWAEKESA